MGEKRMMGEIILKYILSIYEDGIRKPNESC
jgi:hypothetical protein